MQIKAFLILVILSAYLQISQAQDGVHTFHAGVRAGLNASQISGDDLAGFNKMGASAGIFVNRAVVPSGRLAVQMEIDFSMKGSHSKASSANVTNNFYVLNLWYVEVPVLLKWSAGRWTMWGKPFQFDLEAGPAVGVRVYQHEREASGPIVGRPDFRRFEFSALAGVSFRISGRHGVGLRYSNSFIPVRVPTWVYGRAVKKQFNSVLTIAYDYTFN